MSRKKTARDAHVSGGINHTDRPYLSAPTLRGVCRAVGFGTKRAAPVAGFHRAHPSTTRDKAIYFLQMHPTIVPGVCQERGRKKILKASSWISHLRGYAAPGRVWYNDQENHETLRRGVGTGKAGFGALSLVPPALASYTACCTGMVKGALRTAVANKQKNKQQIKGRKAGWIAFGVTALLYAAIFPLYRIGDFILAAAVAFLVGKVVSIMGSGLDLTTHNREDREREANQVAELPLSGDDAADAMISRGQDMLHQIRSENDAIPDEVLSGQMDELEHLCVQIFKTVAEKPGKALQIRKFMDYYLPTTLKMLASYRTMSNRGVSVSDMTEARSTVIRGMGMVLTACQKQLDTLYKDDILDVSTDIDVLEQMLKRDGFTEGELGQLRQRAEAPSAAAQQMASTDPQPLNTPPASSSDDFVSFYSRKPADGQDASRS